MLHLKFATIIHIVKALDDMDALIVTCGFGTYGHGNVGSYGELEHIFTQGIFEILQDNTLWQSLCERLGSP